MILSQAVKSQLAALLATSALLLAATPDAYTQAKPLGERPSSERFELRGQYRLRSIHIEPLELSGEQAREMDWSEQRLRLDGRFTQPGIGAINIQVDALDGVLFGDNGSFGGSPSSHSGVSLTTRIPNVTRWEVGLPHAQADPLDRQSYVPVLADAPLLNINYAYADINLPIGLLRVGRQPLAYGHGLAVNDGGDYNRWGVSQFSDAADRILFGTKLDEAFYVATRGKDHVPDTSLDSGVIFGLFYDFLKQDLPQATDDDLRQIGGTLEYRRKQADWFGLDWRNVGAGLRLVSLRNERFNTSVWSTPGFLQASIGNVDLSGQFVYINGSTREISEGFAALTGRPVSDQDITGLGAQFVADVHLGPATLTLELNYASGDDDPRPTTPITTFNFARDMNVGVLLFEHIMAFETARSVSVGLENLASGDARSFPLDEVRTEGRFTNAMAVFPQLYLDLLKRENNRVHVRFGGLFAWSAAQGGVVDPILTSLNEDGARIDDDAVNFHGGTPARYYGAELDWQVGWKFKDHFQWLVEGAVLFPGSAIYDANGNATRSFLIENRFVFNF